jgi:hypothetical protein
MPAGPAIAVAVISRVAMTIADLTWALLALGLGGHARRGHGGQPGQSGRRPDSAPSVPPRRTDALGQEAGV